MIAMELNGSHVGKKIRVTYRKTKRSKADTVVERKAIFVKHYGNGDVELAEESYGSYNYASGRYENRKKYRYPYNAIVEFIDD